MPSTRLKKVNLLQLSKVNFDNSNNNSYCSNNTNSNKSSDNTSSNNKSNKRILESEVLQRVHRMHNIMLSPRSTQKIKNSKPYCNDNIKTFKSHVVRLSCPSCTLVVEKKILLSSHMDQHIGL